MSKLKAVDPKTAAPSKPKIVIYGKPGAGKTWTSLDFPKCYYIDTEGGADLEHYTDKLRDSGGVYMGPDQGSLSFDTIMEQVQALATERHEYKTLVIDSITKVFNNEIANESERLAKAKEKNEFGRDKKPAVQYMKRLVSWLQRLDMNVILICHEKAEWKNGEQIGETFDCWEKLEYELHLCLRVAKTSPTSRKAYVRKTRLKQFPEGSLFDWSFEEFANRYGRDVIMAEAKPIEVATAEQVAEVSSLLERVKVDEDFIEKCLNKANVETLAELDSDKINAIIASLKGKLA